MLDGVSGRGYRLGIEPRDFVPRTNTLPLCERSIHTTEPATQEARSHLL